MAIIIYRGIIKFGVNGRFYFTVYQEVGELYYVQGWYKNIPGQKAMIRLAHDSRYATPVQAVLDVCIIASDKILNDIYDT